MRNLSRLAAILLAMSGFAVFASTASAGENLATKIPYATESSSSLLLNVSRKPCCHEPWNGTFYRKSAKTCSRIGGHIVHDRYCDNQGDWRDPRWGGHNWNDPRYAHPQPWQDPRWSGGQHGYALCCKRGRKEWWVRSAWQCGNSRGALVHPGHCRNN